VPITDILGVQEMPLVINTNVSSLNAQRHLQASRNDLETAMERLSSGKRINSAMEDAAGLTIAHSLETKVKSLETAARNANDAISLIHLAEGAMDAVSSMLVRMRELATQALNGTYSSTDRTNLDAEFQQLSDEITRVANNTYFNGISVIGSYDTLNFQIGYEASDSISLGTQRISADYIGTMVYEDGGGTTTTTNASIADTGTITSGSLSITNQPTVDSSAVTLSEVGLTGSDTTNAASALTVVDAAISQIDSYRVSMGAVANRLDHSVENLYSRIEQQTAAMSRIQDADYAVESANLARAQVLQQAGTAMLAQANASTQNVLSLLK
jgi:flagellin